MACVVAIVNPISDRHCVGAIREARLVWHAPLVYVLFALHLEQLKLLPFKRRKILQLKVCAQINTKGLFLSEMVLVPTQCKGYPLYRAHIAYYCCLRS